MNKIMFWWIFSLGAVISAWAMLRVMGGQHAQAMQRLKIETDHRRAQAAEAGAQTPAEAHPAKKLAA